jgi:hypothetical protein
VNDNSTTELDIKHPSVLSIRTLDRDENGTVESALVTFDEPVRDSAG